MSSRINELSSPMAAGSSTKQPTGIIDSKPLFYQMTDTEIFDGIRYAQENGTVFHAKVDPSTFDAIRETRLVREDVPFEYDEETRELRINKLPGDIHEAVNGFFIVRAGRTIDKLLKSGEHTDVVRIAPSARVNSFTGEAHSRTTKESDAAIYPNHRADNKDLPYVVVENGFSEAKIQLMHDMKLWLDHTDGAVRAVVVVMVTEGSRARLKLDEDKAFVQPPRKLYKYTEAMRKDTYILKPQEHAGYIAVGELSVVIQVWRPNAGVQDGAPFHQCGGRKDFEARFCRENQDMDLHIPLTLEWTLATLPSTSLWRSYGSNSSIHQVYLPVSGFWKPYLLRRRVSGTLKR